MTEQKSNNKLKNGIILIIVFFLGVGTTYALFHYFPTIIGTVETKYKKDVTITDTGIADAVEKLYDAVIVINTYVKDEAYAQGTGFVYKISGDTAYILTNNHVINNATDVYATFTDGDRVKTKIVGNDIYSDIAVLSVDKKDVTTVAELGKSEDSRLGDTVFAIGAPLDSAYSWSVTRGIVSGKDRLVEVELSDGNNSTPMVVNTLQTDAAINSGNSGGPLANSNGEVIGITSIKLASEKIEGMGFAIPIENALDIAEELISGNKISRPYLGIYMLDVTTAAYQSREYRYLIEEAEVNQGVLVTEIEPKSSAALGGIEAGDIIIEIDDNEIPSVAYLRYYLFKHKAGDDMEVTVKRGSETKHLRIRLTAGN